MTILEYFTTIHQRKKTTNYKVIGGRPEGKKKIFMLGQEIPESLEQEAPEPNVTG